MTSVLRTLIGPLVVAAATVATWWVWLGRDTEYQIDANGNTTGPYTTAQVAGCVLTMLVVLVVAVLAGVHPLAAAAAMTVAFTVAWTVQAAFTDDSGLFAVGAILVFAGTATGSTMVALLTRLLAGRKRIST